MKTQIKTLIKFSSLLFAFAVLVLGLYASNNHDISTEIYAQSTKRKISSNPNNNKDLKLALLDNEIIESQRNLENWMFQKLEIQDDQLTRERELQEWMFDSYFWKIESEIWNESVVEEEREIEEWMQNFKIKKSSFMSIDIYSDFEEKEWMKKHSFIIL